MSGSEVDPELKSQFVLVVRVIRSHTPEVLGGRLVRVSTQSVSRTKGDAGTSGLRVPPVSDGWTFSVVCRDFDRFPVVSPLSVLFICTCVRVLSLTRLLDVFSGVSVIKYMYPYV